MCSRVAAPAAIILYGAAFCLLVFVATASTVGLGMDTASPGPRPVTFKRPGAFVKRLVTLQPRMRRGLCITPAASTRFQGGVAFPNKTLLRLQPCENLPTQRFRIEPAPGDLGKWDSYGMYVVFRTVQGDRCLEAGNKLAANMTGSTIVYLAECSREQQLSKNGTQRWLWPYPALNRYVSGSFHAPARPSSCGSLSLARDDKVVCGSDSVSVFWDLRPVGAPADEAAAAVGCTTTKCHQRR